jgi:hypothetical protein
VTAYRLTPSKSPYTRNLKKSKHYQLQTARGFIQPFSLVDVECLYQILRDDTYE